MMKMKRASKSRPKSTWKDWPLRSQAIMAPTTVGWGTRHGWEHQLDRVDRHVGNKTPRCSHLALPNGRKTKCIDHTFVNGSLACSGVDQSVSLDRLDRFLSRLGDLLQNNLRWRYVHLYEWSADFQGLRGMDWLLLTRLCIEATIQNGH